MKILFLFVTCLLAASAWSAVRAQSTTITQPASAAPITGTTQVDAPVVVKPTAYLPSLPPRSTVPLMLKSSADSVLMRVDSFTGAVTKRETDSFLRYVSSLVPDSDNQNNHWSYGASGQAVRAIGMVYEINQDVRLLNQMIRFCDADLAVRNDLAPAPVGQHIIWTGRIDPVWPNNLKQEPLTTGGEQGDPVGNLGYCASLILKTKTLWKKPVPDRDPHHYGDTYLARAKTYVKEGDVAIDGHILNGLVDLSHEGHQYFSAVSPYKGGTPVPWNQQMMFNYAFQNMAIAHRLLRDDDHRAAKYHKIVEDSLSWFFSEGQQTAVDKTGRPTYNWGYAMPSRGGEDATHAGMDVAGFYGAFATGDFGLTPNEMTPFANMLIDVMTLAPNIFAGRVDGTSGSGHAAETKDLRSGYVLLAEFRPDAYLAIVSADLVEGGTTTRVDLFTRFLWAKNQRARARTR
jgi:hypothetical protein